MQNVTWPARMQRLRTGPLVEAVGDAELWLDGGHNPAAGNAIAALLTSLPAKETHLICGMLNTKDVGGYLRPLAAVAKSLTAVSIPNEINTLPSQDTADAAHAQGLAACTAPSVAEAIAALTSSGTAQRILICGSLYLAGNVLRDNG
jgi:dihydrofolate synthase/folylpolyglutamate synthase